jgi:dihydrofolate reductase
MRKIIAAEFMSLDGVVGAPNEWTGPYFSPEVQQELGAPMATTDTLLIGRVTYQEFVPFWADKTGDEDPVAAHMSKPKLVVSTTLKSVDEWPNSKLISGDVVDELAKIKQQAGKDIQIIGSGALVRSLLAAGAVDELDLLLFPIVVGKGKRLFVDGADQIPLQLAGSKSLDSGVLSIKYTRAAA